MKNLEKNQLIYLSLELILGIVLVGLAYLIWFMDKLVNVPLDYYQTKLFLLVIFFLFSLEAIPMLSDIYTHINPSKKWLTWSLAITYTILNLLIGIFSLTYLNGKLSNEFTRICFTYLHFIPGLGLLLLPCSCHLTYLFKKNKKEEN